MILGNNGNLSAGKNAGSSAYMAFWLLASALKDEVCVY